MVRRVTWDRHALQTNLLANAVILGSGFLTLLASLFTVLRRGRTDADVEAMAAGDWIVVPGHALEAGAPSTDFRARLDRALALHRHMPSARILLLGGVVPGQVVSEAAAGAAYLEARGVDSGRIQCEAASRHTLENFQQALPLLRGARIVILVTNRYHLARAGTMAANLGIPATMVPAEPAWRADPALFGKLLWEAYLLHWYHVGRLYARATRNRGMLQRVSRRPGAE